MLRAKASPSKRATVASRGLNYDMIRFARSFWVGYCGMNREKTMFRPGQYIYIYSFQRLVDIMKHQIIGLLFIKDTITSRYYL